MHSEGSEYNECYISEETIKKSHRKMASEVRLTVDSSFRRRPKDLETNAKTNARH